MATFKFFLQSINNPAGIYVRVREGKHIDAKAKTKFAINPQHWSSQKGQVKNLKDEGYKKLHEELNKFQNKLLTHYNQSVNKKIIDSNWLKEFINPTSPINELKIPSKLVDYFEYYSIHHNNTLTKATHTKLRVNKHLIERFQKSTNMVYYISDVNANFKLAFENYCLENKYSPNTIARTIRFIKTICYHAKSNGIETHYQLESIKTKVLRIDKIFLSQDEIEKIENIKLTATFLDTARDWLIISCETGQRISDFLRFKKEFIRYENKIPLIEFTQVKTKKKMAIPLSKRVRKILEKRKGNFPDKVNDKDYNINIKTVCQKAGLTYLILGSRIDKEINRKMTGQFPKYELVTSHIGRRSFATNHYGKIPTPLLMNCTGHTTEKTFLEYIGKTETIMAKQLASYFE